MTQQICLVFRPMTKNTGLGSVALLCACMAFNQTSLSLIMTIAALAGQMVAVDKSLATLPLAFIFVGMLVATIPMSLFMRRYGRRLGFVIGAIIGSLGGLLAAYGLWIGELAVMTAGLGLYGLAAGTANFYRFAAGEVAAPEYKSRAISYVLIGGIVAAVAGPFLAGATKELIQPFSFLGGFLAVAVLSALILPFQIFTRFAPQSAAERGAGAGRPLKEIIRQPKFIVAALGAAVGYGCMNLIMVSTPLAMQGCGLPFGDAVTVIQWHVLGMYVPSFFTGHLIRRFGVTRIMAIGAGLILCCVAVNLSGLDYWHFWSALVLLGMGWNFLYIGGTTLLTETYRPEERAKVQGINDFLVFGTTALTALSSGAAMSGWGWNALNFAVMPMIGLVLVATLWLGRRPAPTAA